MYFWVLQFNFILWNAFLNFICSYYVYYLYDGLRKCKLSVHVCYYSYTFFSQFFKLKRSSLLNFFSSQSCHNVFYYFIAPLRNFSNTDHGAEVFREISAVIPGSFLCASVCCAHYFVCKCFFFLCALLYICQQLMSSTILSLIIWHWDDTLQLLIYDIFATRKFCNPPAFPVSMLHNAVSYGPPFIMQFHCSLPPSFCLSTS